MSAGRSLSYLSDKDSGSTGGAFVRSSILPARTTTYKAINYKYSMISKARLYEVPSVTIVALVPHNHLLITSNEGWDMKSCFPHSLKRFHSMDTLSRFYHSSFFFH